MLEMCNLHFYFLGDLVTKEIGLSLRKKNFGLLSNVKNVKTMRIFEFRLNAICITMWSRGGQDVECVGLNEHSPRGSNI